MSVSTLTYLCPHVFKAGRGNDREAEQENVCLRIRQGSQAAVLSVPSLVLGVIRHIAYDPRLAASFAKEPRPPTDHTTSGPTQPQIPFAESKHSLVILLTRSIPQSQINSHAIHDDLA